MRIFWKWWLKKNGWTIVGQYPYTLKKLLIAVAPHTHWVDFPIGLAVRSLLRINHARFLGKAELFKPPLGFIFHWLGGTPVDRSKHNNLVEAVVEKFNRAEQLTIAMAPEGTRKKVDRLKTGFYHIARQAQIPILLVGFDFGKKQVVLNQPFYPTANEQQDMQYILEFYSRYTGKLPDRDVRHLREG